MSKGRRKPLWGQAFHGNVCFQEWLPEEFVERISQLDSRSPVTKINGKRQTPLQGCLFDSVCVSNVQVWGTDLHHHFYP